MTKPIILLATVGASPQVVTETLYAIHQQQLGWPSELRIITTTFGAQKVRQGLLEQGHLQRLCYELGDLPVPAFADHEDYLRIVPDAEGNPVDDARTRADHEALADFIVKEVQAATANEQQRVHASLAGGRKTMTFYLGYAMSLFGRADDVLSHVLISEGFEGHPDFWFPTQAPDYKTITNRAKQLDASSAEVLLTTIPFITHRHELPTLLQNSELQQSFNEIVGLINLAEAPEKIYLEIDKPKRSVYLYSTDDKQKLLASFEFNLLEFTFYLMVAEATIEQRVEIFRPGAKGSASLFTLYLTSLKQLLKIDASIPQDLVFKRLEDAGISSTTLKVWQESSSIKPGWFDDRNNKIQQAFKQQLPERLAKRITPRSMFSDIGESIFLDIDYTYKNGGYGIPLPQPGMQIKVF